MNGYDAVAALIVKNADLQKFDQNGYQTQDASNP